MALIPTFYHLLWDASSSSSGIAPGGLTFALYSVIFTHRLSLAIQRSSRAQMYYKHKEVAIMEERETTNHPVCSQGTRSDYERANGLRELFNGKVRAVDIKPHWFKNDSLLWYRNNLPGGGHEFVVVDAEAGKREQAFDHTKLANALSEATEKEVRPDQLPFDNIEFPPDDNAVTFQAEGRIWRCDLDTYSLTQIGEVEEEQEEKQEDEEKDKEEESPDGQWVAFFRNHNLYVRHKETGEEFPLSMDGGRDDAYSGDIAWSPDSEKIVALRTKQGGKHEVYLIESSPEDQVQPKLHSFNYLKPGDQIPLPKPQLFHVAGRKHVLVRDELFPNSWSIKQVRWASDSQSFTFIYNQRGHQILRVIAVDAETGAARTVIDEQSETFVDYAYKQFSHCLDEEREIIWMSERDGWNHLYLYDTESGQVKNQITSGEWVALGVDHVDEKKRQIWFRASGIYPEQDPYYVHYCRINFDGSALVILTEGDGTHSVEYSPDRRFLVDTWSRVDYPPVTELRNAEDGSPVCELERADWADLLATGWQIPERFVAKGRDGETDIYGLIYRPTTFDPGHTYPVIEMIYAGPHGYFVPKAFDAFRKPQEVAELGFIVVRIDGMGTSGRSKKFHDVCWKNLGDSGFPDRILWIKAAAEKYPYMDISRVGIYGGSAGGQSSTRAMLAHGDFYKVAVSDCGCHDNRMDKVWWNELWMSWPIGPHYEENSNVTHAHKLEGKLMLIVGELDRNVDPASTMQVVNALIKADKDFDMLVVPGGGHGIAESVYGNRRRQDFFVRHLLGVEPRSKP